MRPTLYDLVIYNNKPYYITCLQKDPDFVTIRSVFIPDQVTDYLSNMTRTNLSLADIQNLDITSNSQFFNQFPEYFL